jgi:hypothetical protein
MKTPACLTACSAAWGLLDASLGLALAAWLFTGGLLALWQTQQASERLRSVQAWSDTEVIARHSVGQRLQRAGAPEALRLSAGGWTLRAPWPALSTPDARQGPWQFAHATLNTPLNCQGGAAQEAQHIDAYAWSSPDRLLCHNPLHAGNVRQTLWGGIRGWTIQVAVRVSDAPQTWQWQTLSPAHTGEAIAALRVCWRTSPESTTAWAGLEGGTTALACALPSSPGPVRDRWQLIARWHGQQPVL